MRRHTKKLNKTQTFPQNFKQNININRDVSDDEDERIIEIKEKEIEEIKEEKINNNCSSEKHEEKEAKIYCIECKINMCNICEIHHSELFSKHHIYNINSKDKNIFTGFCQEKNHNMKLDYYCKKHNILCCAACICKIKANGNGNHNKCNVHFIKDIKNIINYLKI